MVHFVGLPLKASGKGWDRYRRTMVCLWGQTIVYILGPDGLYVTQCAELFCTGFAEFEHVGLVNPFWGPLLDARITSLLYSTIYQTE